VRARLTFILPLLTILPGLASAACPQLSGNWHCAPYGGPALTYAVTQSTAERSTFSVAVPALGIVAPISLEEGRDLVMPNQDGFLAVSSFSCDGQALTLKSRMARRVEGQEVPAELLIGDQYPKAPTTIWNVTTLSFSLSEKDELLVRGRSDFSTNDSALRPEGSMPMEFSCRRH
jgi:hypothetical protein